MNTLFRISVLLISFLLLIVSGPAMAQRTGDGIVPAIETVCDGDPFSFGLCNSYCEALDCDSDTPLGTPRACNNVLTNYMKKSGGLAPQCGPVEATCPCEFDVAQDYADLLDAAALGGFQYQVDLASLQTYCNTIGQPSVTYFVTQASEPSRSEYSPQGLQQFHWVSVSEESAACVIEGGGIDGDNALLTPEGIWAWGPYLERSIELDQDEVSACQTALQQLCSELEAD